jgi:CRISPR system Cascade subunit CasD
MSWLVVLIAAPLASFSEEPGNARRGSADRPTYSALLGLAGAALGVERADRAGQEALAASFLTATRTLAAGAPLSDFHTFQSLPTARGAVATRADALARRSELETSITRRDYRSDGQWQAAYTTRDGASVSHDDLRAAFLRPRFALWAGRKSCPLAHPLAPLLVATNDVETAFAAHERHVGLPSRSSSTTIAIDSRIAPLTRANAARQLRRMDEPEDRMRWQFSARYEVVFRMAPPKETET